MIQPHPFRRALEAGDVEAMVATLSPDVVVHGSAVQRPIVGRAEVSRLLQAVVTSFHAFTQELPMGHAPLSGLTARGDAVRAERNFALVPSLDSRDRAITPASQVLDRQAEGRPA
jgi:ketosteroid isomerase-like protein